MNDSKMTHTRYAVHDIVRMSKFPLSLIQIREELLKRKIRIKRLAVEIDKLVQTGNGIYRWPAYRRRGRVWHQSPNLFARSAIIEYLSNEPATRSDLDRLLRNVLFECSRSHACQFRKKIVAKLLKEKRLFEHPPVGRQRISRYGVHAPDPKPYLMKAKKEMDRVCQSLQRSGVKRETVLRSLCEWFSFSIPLSEDRPTEADTGPMPRMEQMIIDKTLELKPVARNQALVSVLEIRKALNMSKADFDTAILELAKREKIFLHKHVYPAQLNTNERKQMVTDGEGNYYMGIVLRKEGA
jgi:hypothetical protein